MVYTGRQTNWTNTYQPWFYLQLVSEDEADAEMAKVVLEQFNQCLPRCLRPNNHHTGTDGCLQRVGVGGSLSRMLEESIPWNQKLNPDMGRAWKFSPKYPPGKVCWKSIRGLDRCDALYTSAQNKQDTKIAKRGVLLMRETRYSPCCGWISESRLLFSDGCTICSLLSSLFKHTGGCILSRKQNGCRQCRQTDVILHYHVTQCARNSVTDAGEPGEFSRVSSDGAASATPPGLVVTASQLETLHCDHWK